MGGALVLLLLPTTLLAHGGEDHGPEPASPAPPVVIGGAVEGGSEVFEALLRLPEDAVPGRPLDVRILLADAVTNAPIAGATLELALSGPSSVAVQATATGEPGIYPVSLPALQAGDYDATVSVEAGGRSDLLLLQTLKIAVAKPSASGGEPVLPGLPRLLALAAGVLLVALAIAVALRERRRRRAGRASS